jgi:uncharacterized phage protein gp47/JayE
MTSLLTPEGLTIRTTAEVLQRMQDGVRARFGPQAQVGAHTAMGQLLQVPSIEAGDLWMAVRACYDSADPDNASGQQMGNIAGLNGVQRDPATHSGVKLDFEGTPATVIPAGSVYRAPNGPQWETTEEATIEGGGTVTDVPAQSVETGPITAEPDTITEAVTPIAGVTSVNNPLAAIPGRNVETDAELRQKREAGFSLASTATDPGVRARVAELDSVKQARVISNRSDDIDALGIPAHSQAVIIWPAQLDNEPVWRVLLDNIAGGIRPYGDIQGTATDSEGIEQDVAYSLATAVDVWVEVQATKDPINYGGDDRVEVAVLAFFSGLLIGQTVVLSQIARRVQTDVAGVTDIKILASTAGAPGPGDDSNIPIEQLEIAVTEAAKIDVEDLE